MYDIYKRRKRLKLKVKDLIKELEKENPEAQITICGDDYVCIHVERDNSVVTLDNEDLDDCYEEVQNMLNIVPEIEVNN